MVNADVDTVNAPRDTNFIQTANLTHYDRQKTLAEADSSFSAQYRLRARDYSFRGVIPFARQLRNYSFGA